MPPNHLQRVLVTGASGTLGYNIVRRLGAKYPKIRLETWVRTAHPGLLSGGTNGA